MKAAELEIRLSYAKEDITILNESGFMAITDTTHGVLNLSLEDGIYTASTPTMEIKTTSEEDMINFIASSYQMDDEIKTYFFK